MLSVKQEYMCKIINSGVSPCMKETFNTFFELFSLPQVEKAANEKAFRDRDLGSESNSILN